MNLFEKIKFYKLDILAVSLLCLVFGFLMLIFWGHQGSPIIDCGREAYIPMEVLKGKLLYKDILCTYGPFAYQLNAVLYWIFGQNLNTLYTAGAINSLIIVITVYLISRTMTEKLVSWTISFLVMALFVFNYFITNFNFPYSYAIVYALSTFLIAVLLTIYYLKTNNHKFIPYIFFFMGVSTTSKPEYSLFIGLLILIILLKQVPRKYILAGVAAFVVTPLVCWSVLFLQGLTIPAYLSNLEFVKNLVSGMTFKYFYSNFVGFFFNPELFKFTLSIFLSSFLAFGLLAGIIYLALVLVNILSGKLTGKKFVALKSFVIAGLIMFIPKSQIHLLSEDISLAWIPLSTTLILLFLLGFYFKKFNIAEILRFKEGKIADKAKYCVNGVYEKLLSIELKDKIFILLLVTGLISTLKSYFFVTLHIFGTFILPLALLVNVIFLVDYIPKFVKFLNRRLWSQTCLIILIVSGVFFSLKYTMIARNQNTHPVATAKGTIYTNYDWAYSLNQAIEYIDANIPKESTFLMVPEGPLLNFLTGRTADNKYFNLFPPFIEAFGEYNVLNDLKNNPPDYILINNRDSSDFIFRYFGVDYGFRLYDFITQSYTFKKEIGNGLKIRIYKKN